MANCTCMYSVACSPLGYSKCPSRMAPVRRNKATTSSCVGTRCMAVFIVACYRTAWRTHSCVPCSHSCEHWYTVGGKRSHECERGTQECVRHGVVEPMDNNKI